MRTKPLLGSKPWFGPRRLGWGLSPVSTEGWVVTLVAIAAAVAAAVFARLAGPWAALVVVVLLLITVFAKGTSPGGPRQWEEFQASRKRGGS